MDRFSQPGAFASGDGAASDRIRHDVRLSRLARYSVQPGEHDRAAADFGDWRRSWRALGALVEAAARAIRAGRCTGRGAIADSWHNHCELRRADSRASSGTAKFGASYHDWRDDVPGGVGSILSRPAGLADAESTAGGAGRTGRPI